jgi:hypothetical protein
VTFASYPQRPLRDRAVGLCGTFQLPISRVVSRGRCNTGLQFIGWSLKSQGLSRPGIETQSDCVQLRLREGGQVGILWQALPQEAVRVFVLSRAARDFADRPPSVCSQRWSEASRGGPNGRPWGARPTARLVGPLHSRILRPPWRATSRFTVDEARLRRWAMIRSEQPLAIPREMSSRSASVSERRFARLPTTPYLHSLRRRKRCTFSWDHEHHLLGFMLTVLTVPASFAD